MKFMTIEQYCQTSIIPRQFIKYIIDLKNWKNVTDRVLIKAFKLKSRFHHQPALNVQYSWSVSFFPSISMCFCVVNIQKKKHVASITNINVVLFSFTISCLVNIIKTIYLSIDDYPKKRTTMSVCRDQNVKTNYRQNKNKKFVHIWDIYVWEISFACEDWQQ